MTRRLVFGEQPCSTGERRTSHWSERGDSMAVRLRFPLLLCQVAFSLATIDAAAQGGKRGGGNRGVLTRRLGLTSTSARFAKTQRESYD